MSTKIQHTLSTITELQFAVYVGLRICVFVDCVSVGEMNVHAGRILTEVRFDVEIISSCIHFILQPSQKLLLFLLFMERT